jgi:hypothetical protein
VSVLELSEAELADRWGAVKKRADKVDAEIEALKAEFDRRNMLSARGLKFTVVKSVQNLKRLAVAAIREEMGVAWCKAREVPSSRTTYEVNALPKG